MSTIKRAFTLIELIVVVIIIGIVSFLVIKLPTFSSAANETVENIRKSLSPYGVIYIVRDEKGSHLLSDANLSLNLQIDEPEVYVYDNGIFIKKSFDRYKDKDVIFKYSVSKGIGDSFILKCREGIYLFKPLFIKRVKSFEEAKREYLLSAYQPKSGNYK